MPLFTSEELAKLIYVDYEGINFIGYKFKIKKSPLIRLANGKTFKVISCTCAFHSVKDVDMKKHCRFTKATLIYRKALKERGEI